MKRKGQAAMEFLMTYGWAILIVLAAIGALAYFGVLSPNKLLPARTTFQAPLPNVDTATITQAEISLPMRNSVGSPVSIDLFDVAPNSNGNCGTVSGIEANVENAGWVALPVNVSNGERFQIHFVCSAIPDVGSRFKDEFVVTYTNQDSLSTKPHKGSIEGEVVG